MEALKLLASEGVGKSPKTGLVCRVSPEREVCKSFENHPRVITSSVRVLWVFGVTRVL